MPKETFVSVIVVNYNGKKFIKECLDSVLNSAYPCFEIVIVDNGSTDGSFDYLKSVYASEPKVRLVRSNKQLYFTGGCNLGAKNSQGEKLLFLNSDTVVDKNWIRELIKFNKDHKRWIIQPKILKQGKNGVIDTAGGIYTFFGFGLSRGNGKKDVGQYNKNERVGYASGTCFMIDRNFFKELDGLDEWYKYHYEDVDLNLRAKSRGGESWYCHKSVIYHKGSLTFKGNVANEDLLFNIRKNRLRTVVKNFASWEKFLRILALLLVHLVLAVQDFFTFRPKRMFLTVKSIMSLLDNLGSRTTQRPPTLEGGALARYIFAARSVEGKKVLDIGTGLGGGAHYLTERGAKKVLGIDNSKIAIKAAMEKFALPSLEFRVVDALDILNLNDRFDVIVAFEIIEHLPLGSYSAFIDNLKKILTPEGVCLISTPNKLVSSPDYQKPENPYHTKEFTPQEFAALIKKFFPKTELLGIECTNREFLEKDKLIKRTWGNRFAVFLSKFKITHELLPLVPAKLRTKVTSRDLLPLLKATDFKITNENVDKCRGLLAVCQI